MRRDHGMPGGRLARLLACTLCCMFLARVAAADDLPAPKRAEARALFEDAMKLVEQGQLADACPKLAASHKLDPGMGVLYQLANCLERTGKLASAWGLFLELTDLAKIAKMDAREKYARERADALRVRLTRMMVVVPVEVAAVSGLSITRDGSPLAKAQWGTSIPVDPGKHVVTVVAPGKRQWETSVEALGEGSTVSVTIPQLKEEPPVGPVVPVTATVPAEPSAPWSATRRAGAAVAAGGVAGLVAGIALGVAAGGPRGAIEAHCRLQGEVNHCDAEGKAATDQAFALANGANVAFAVGGLSLAVGGVMFFLGGESGGPSGAGSGTKVSLVPLVAPGTGGFMIQGRY